MIMIYTVCLYPHCIRCNSQLTKWNKVDGSLGKRLSGHFQSSQSTFCLVLSIYFGGLRLRSGKDAGTSETPFKCALLLTLASREWSFRGKEKSMNYSLGPREPRETALLGFPPLAYKWNSIRNSTFPSFWQNVGWKKRNSDWNEREFLSRNIAKHLVWWMRGKKIWSVDFTIY